MPSPVTRDRRQFKPASQPAPVEDDQPAAVAPPEEAPAPAPVAEAPTPTGTTGGLVPQQAGTWDKPGTQPTSADPQQRAQQSLQREQEQFAAQQQAKNPFIFSNAIPDLSKVTDARHKERVVAAGERDYREQQMQQRTAQVQQRRDAIGQQKTRNAKLEDQFRSTGQQFYTDPFGDIKPIIEASSGRPLFHATTWEEGTHPKTGEPVLQKRDQYGQRQFKTPPIVASPDLTDDQLYYKFGDNDLRPAGKIDDLVNHPNFDIARLAKRTASSRKKAMWKEAIDPLESVAANATVAHDIGQQKAMDLQDQIAKLNETSANMDPAVLEEKEGGVMGFGAKPTQRALQAQKQKSDIEGQIESLTGNLVKLNEDLKPSGALGRAKRQSALDVAIFKAKALHDNYSDLADERRLILRQQGKSEADDPTLKSILAAQQEYGTQLERGIGASQREDTAHAPAAQAQPTPREQASSPVPPPDAPKDIKKQWESSTPIQRLKMMMGVQRGNTEIDWAPPAIGSEAAGTKGSAFTVPKAEGEGILPGVINAANKFTSGLTTPENAALMAGGSVASFAAKIAEGTKAALAAHAVETGLNATFTAQMAKDTVAASKEAYKVIKDPSATDKEKADAITGAILSGGMTAFAAKGAKEGAESTVKAAKKVVAEKKSAPAESKKTEPSAAAKAAEARRAAAKQQSLTPEQDNFVSKKLDEARAGSEVSKAQKAYDAAKKSFDGAVEAHSKGKPDDTALADAARSKFSEMNTAQAALEEAQKKLTSASSARAAAEKVSKTPKAAKPADAASYSPGDFAKDLKTATESNQEMAKRLPLKEGETRDAAIKDRAQAAQRIADSLKPGDKVGDWTIADGPSKRLKPGERWIKESPVPVHVGVEVMGGEKVVRHGDTKPSSAKEAAEVFEPALKEKENTPPPSKSAEESAQVFSSEAERQAHEAKTEAAKESRVQSRLDELSGGDDATRKAILARRSGLTTDQFLSALDDVADFRKNPHKYPDLLDQAVKGEARASHAGEVDSSKLPLNDNSYGLPAEFKIIEDARAAAAADRAAAGHAGATQEEVSARRAGQEMVGKTAQDVTVPPEEPPTAEEAQAAQARETRSAVKERAATIDKSLTADERLRQSPAGGEALKNDLKNAAAPERARYDEIQAKLNELGPSKFNSPEFQDLWKESEAIKNRNKGMPPGEVAGGMDVEEAPVTKSTNANPAETKSAPARQVDERATKAAPATADVQRSEPVAKQAPAEPAAKETIKSAAVRFADGEVRTGKTHAEIMGTVGERDMRGSEDGFVTGDGKFVSREDAAAIADKSGQAKEKKPGLTTENVKEAPANPDRIVRFETPGPNGPMTIAGRVTRVMPDGRLEVRAQQGGYHIISPDEIKASAEAKAPTLTNPNPEVEKGVFARTEPKPRADVDHGTRYTEWRTRKITADEYGKFSSGQRDRMAIGDHLVERRTIKTEDGKPSEVGEWEKTGSGKSKRAAMESAWESSLDNAKSLDSTHGEMQQKNETDRVRAEQDARGKAEAAQKQRELHRVYIEEVRNTPIKGKRGEIALSWNGEGGKAETKMVPGTTYGDWGVWKDEKGKYNITHIPSGKRAFQTDSLSSAQDMVRGFVHSGVDASTKDITTDPAVLKKVLSVINGVRTDQVPDWFKAKKPDVSQATAPIDSGNPKKDAAPVSADVEKSTPASVEGDKINRSWTAFDKDSGTLGVPREEMPQIKSEHRGALVQFLKARGVEARAGMIDPSKLKPTQAEFSAEKVQAAREHTGSERPILVSADNHVIDGHHQWMAALDDKSGSPMPVIKLNAPVDRLLSEIKEFPSAQAAEGAKPAPKATEPVPEAAPRLSDRAIEALKKARISKPGEAYSHTPFTLAWDFAIDTAILAIRAGRGVHDAVTLAVNRFKDKFPDHTADDLSSLEQAVRDAHESKPEAAARVEMSGIRAQVSNFLKKGEIEKAMTYTRDAVDNHASVFGREESNSVKLDLQKAFDGKLGESSDALAFAVESGADRAKLDEMRAKLEASTKADPKWKQRALDAINFADKNLEALKPIVDRYNQITNEQMGREQFAGIDTLKRDNYVMHKQDIDESLGHMFLGAAGEGNSSFRKNRTHDTFADSIAAGVDPKSLNAVDLLQSRVTAGQQMANKRAWVESLKQFKDPVSKQPVAVDVTYTKRPDGSQYADAPNGYSVERVGNAEVAVMKGYEGIFSALTDGSWWNKSPVRRMIQQANATGKSLNLLFDTFHLGRLAAWNAATRLNAFGTLGGGVKAPNPFSHGEGVLTLDHSPQDLVRIAKEEGRSPEQIKQLLENKQKLNMALDTGANFGKISDALHEDVMHNLPVTGTFSKWLFDKYQRGAMSEIWLMEYNRQRAMGGNKALSDQQVARNVSQEVNTRFGNLGRQGIFKSKTGQDIARLMLLAPQWNEGLVRSEIGAGTGAIKSAVNAATGKGLATSMLTRSLATMVIGQFVANQLLNQYTRGKYTWENPEEGVGAKLSAWIPDKIGGGPGFFLHPAGIGAEITHLLTSKYEKTADFRKSLVEAGRSRLSAIARPFATYLLGTDSLGRNIRPADIYKETAKEAVPLPIPTSSVVGAAKTLATGDRSENFPGQFQKQLMATGGLKTDQAPTPGSRMSSLATAFNKSKGIEPSGEFYAGDYTDLATALRVGNKANVETTLKDLLAKHSAAEIAKHFSRQIGAPFTGNTKREPDFIKSLTQEQKDTYRQARRDRQKLREQANAAMRSYMAKNKVEGMAEALQAMMASPSNR